MIPKTDPNEAFREDHHSIKVSQAQAPFGNPDVGAPELAATLSSQRMPDPNAAPIPYGSRAVADRSMRLSGPGGM